LSGPIPARVDAAATTILLGVVDDAVKAGWSLARICGVLELDRQRAWRWRHRQVADRLEDLPGGGNPHGLLAWKEAEILAVFEEWGEVDRSHRKLAQLLHRTSVGVALDGGPSRFDCRHRHRPTRAVSPLARRGANSHPTPNPRLASP